MPVPMVL